MPSIHSVNYLHMYNNKQTSHKLTKSASKAYTVPLKTHIKLQYITKICETAH